ncbi:hypothetical protein [Pseudomonas sp. A2]|uniref:hypothetical protein n=1 Tax=Pseudomonas sp. A2 TaxID=107445 RepID=UPI0020003E4B|nr:hypothetical protein [Pseudomonas sp. A2]UPK88662.1 hypothetical protein E5221_28515 [Pseudomonas sp. A2]
MLETIQKAKEANVLPALMLLYGVDFDADVWSLKPTIVSVADESVIFDWAFYAKYDSEKFLDERYQLILKRTAGCLLVGLGTNRNSPSTVKTKIYILAAFLAEAQRIGEYELSVITVRRAQQIFLNMCNRLSRGGNLAASTLISRMNVIRVLYFLRAKAGSGLSFDPFPPKLHRRIRQDAREASFWEAPPEPVALHILRRAINIVEDLGPDICRIFNKYFEGIQDALAEGYKTRKRISPYGKRAIANESFEKTQRIPELEAFAAYNPLHVAHLRKQLMTACFIVISYTVGARVSEIRRATSVSVRSERHPSGEIFHYYCAARSKRKFGIPAQRDNEDSDEVPWVIPPAALTAFRTLKDLSACLRKQCGIDSLWLITAGNSLMTFDPKTKPSILSTSQFNSRLVEFAEFIKLERNTGWKGRIHTHQGRKHFARFAAKRDRRSLADLAIQFSHATPQSIDYSYARPDGEFRRIVAEQISHEVEEVAQALKGADPVNVYTGVGSGQRVNQVKRFLGRLVSSADVKRLLAKGTVLVPCEWGVCIYRQETSACNGTKEYPSPVNRSPSVCVGCSNFMSTSNNRVWWENYVADSERILRQKNIPAQTKVILEGRLREGLKVLDSIAKEN